MNVSDADFMAVSWAANEAVATGHEDVARVLDKLARKINLSLSTRAAPNFSGHRSKYTWRDMPSVLDERST